MTVASCAEEVASQMGSAHMERLSQKVLYCRLNASSPTMTKRMACIKGWHSQTCLGMFLVTMVVVIA